MTDDFQYSTEIVNYDAQQQVTENFTESTDDLLILTFPKTKCYAWYVYRFIWKEDQMTALWDTNMYTYSLQTIANFPLCCDRRVVKDF